MFLKCFSNFYQNPVEYEGKLYSSVEAAFQAAKTNDPQEKELIRRAGSPGEAKKLGRKVKLRSDWEYVKYQIMNQLVFTKFAVPYLMDQLCATGNEPIVEENTWHDNYWGSCTCSKCGNRGKNMLGKILMQTRFFYQVLKVLKA